MQNEKISWGITLYIPIILFISTNILFLLINGVWWDDFTVWNVTEQSLYDYLGPGDANEVVQYWYINLITSIFGLENQILAFHILSLFFNILSIGGMWYILKFITHDRWFTLYTLLLVAVCGIDKTPFLIINSHAVIANCLFYIGFALFVRNYYYNDKFSIYIVSFLWFSSLVVWRTPALLIPFILIYASCKKTHFNYKIKMSYWNAFKYCMAKYWSIIFGCLIFLFFYKTFLIQNGPHASYYVPDLLNLVLSPILSLCSAIKALMYYLSSSIGSIASIAKLFDFILFLSLLLAVYFLLIKNSSSCIFHDKKITVYAFVFLSLTLLLPLSIYGAFNLVGFEEYNSRTLCLASFPIAFILISILSKLNTKVFSIIYALVLLGSFYYSINNQINYGFSVIKQEAIINFLKDNKQLENKSIIVKDMAFSASANESALRNYEYEGLARIAYGKNTQTKIISYYGNNQYELTPQYEIEIYQKKYPITQNIKKIYTAKLILKRIFKHNQYDVDDIIEVRLKSLN